VSARFETAETLDDADRKVVVDLVHEALLPFQPATAAATQGAEAKAAEPRQDAEVPAS